MATTLQNLRDIFYGILREDENSSAYPLSLTDILLNAAQQKLCNWLVINPLTKEEIRKWQLPFLNTDKFYSSIKWTTISTAVATTDTTISVADASEYDSTWSIYIEGNIVTYTGTTATSFTGCSWILFAFPASTKVYPAYTLPSDYSSPINVIYNNRAQLEAKGYDDIYEDLNKYKGTTYWRNSVMPIYESPYKIPPFYSIKDNWYLIIYNLDQEDKPIRLRYEKLPTTMTTSVNATIDNDIYAQTTIPYLAVGEMLYNRGEEQRAADIINYAMWQIREMYRYYNGTSFEKLNGKQYSCAKWRLNI